MFIAIDNIVDKHKRNIYASFYSSNYSIKWISLSKPCNSYWYSSFRVMYFIKSYVSYIKKNELVSYANIFLIVLTRYEFLYFFLGWKLYHVLLNKYIGV